MSEAVLFLILFITLREWENYCSLKAGASFQLFKRYASNYRQGKKKSEDQYTIKYNNKEKCFSC